MPKVIEGIAVATGDLSRKRRKQEKARRRLAIKKEKERREQAAFNALKTHPSRVWGGTRDEAIANVRQSRATGALIANGRRVRRPSTAERTAGFVPPKVQTRLFLKHELDRRPDNNGRFALMASHSLNAPASTFISAFTTRPAADTACLLAYKKGDYAVIRVIDRGPDFHFETVVQHRRAV